MFYIVLLQLFRIWKSIFFNIIKSIIVHVILGGFTFFTFISEMIHIFVSYQSSSVFTTV